MDKVWPPFNFIVCPVSYRQAILESVSPQLSSSRRFYSKDQLLEGAYFSIDKQAIVYLMERFNYSYTIAKQRLQQIYFLESVDDSRPRIAELKQVVTALEHQQLLKRQKYFAPSISGKRALVIGYDHDLELVRIANMLNIELIFQTHDDDQWPELFFFNTLKDEIYYQFNRIAGLIDAGVDPSDITVICQDPDAKFDLKLAAKKFGIPLNHFEIAAIGHSEIAIKAIQHVRLCRDLLLTKAYLQESYHLEDTHLVIELIDEVNSFATPPDIKIAYFSQSVQELSAKPGRYIDGIDFGTGLYPHQKKHVFIIGASQGVIPMIHSDTDFLSDVEKQELGINDSAILNKMETARWQTFLLNQPHLYISYHKHGYQGEKFPSPLFAKLEIKPEEPPLLETEYGRGLSCIKAAALLDDKRVYQINHPQLLDYQTLVASDYNTFDFRFRPFDFGLHSKRMQLSYTAIKTFYQCQFRYYLQYLIKLKDDSDNFYAKFGEFAHELLERAYDPGFDFETTYDNIYAKYEFTAKEQVLLVRLKQDLAEVISFNRDHEANMHLDSMRHEHTIKFRLDEITSFKGKIDKVWITKDDQGHRYLAFVDYKTSSEDFDPRKLPYGHAMQLPTYSLLLHEDPDLRQIEVIGFYIQNIIAGKLVRPLGKDQRQFYREQLRLAGLSTSNMDKLATLDKDFAQSEYIRTIGTVKSGELKKSAKVADSATFESYREIARTNIIEAVKEIRQHNFSINPKRFSNTEHSCQYCPFRDVCFRKDEAYVDIKLAQEDAEDESATE
jgi:ATP-dependent helicase/DNAse subunit B